MFAPEGRYPPAGIFSPAHLIALGVCVALIVLALYFTRNVTMKTLRVITLVFAIFVTVCEIVKITYKFTVAGKRIENLDDWIPLYYCSLFIYYAWCSAFPNRYTNALGDAFLSVGCLTGGAAYLIFPTTSVTAVPIWHFLALHSMTFHSLMVYTGLTYIRKSGFRPSRKMFFRYVAAFLLFAIPAIILNTIYGCNAMMLRDPYMLPTPVRAIYDFSPWIYTAVATVAYIAVPYLVSTAVYFIRNAFLACGQKNAEEQTAQ